VFNVLVSDPLAEQGLEILRKDPEIKVEVKIGLSPEELQSIIFRYDALIVRSETKVTPQILESPGRLKVIGRAGVGVDNIDVEAATKQGIIVMNAPDGNTISAAEYTLALLLSLARNIPQANTFLRSGKWDRKRFMGVELYDKTLGLIGLGRIGREVAKRAQIFGMKVIAYDPFISYESAAKLGVQLMELNELLAKADFISLHAPLTGETRHLLSEKEFAQMKPGVRLINCARGGIIDEKALYQALVEGKVAGAALDVFEKEPPLDSPLLQLENVIAVPHLGASTEEAQINVSVVIATQIIDALKGGSIRNAVNIPVVEAEILKRLEPFLRLSENLGKLQAQLIEGHMEEVHITYSGDIVNYDLAPVTIALIKGILQPILQEAVNYVNASVLARERGIRIIESKSSEAVDFANLITVEVITDKEHRLVAGSSFGHRVPRIVRIDEFYMDAVPSGYMLICTNRDVPGVVGKVGTILGRNSINIAGLQLGRSHPGGKAISVFNVDSPVLEEVLKELRQIKEILSAKLVIL